MKNNKKPEIKGKKPIKDWKKDQKLKQKLKFQDFKY